MKEVHLHDSVALLEDAPTTHYATGEPVILRPGQVGTVVVTYNGSAFDVEFNGRDGRAFAIASVPGDKLALIGNTPEPATTG